MLEAILKAKDPNRKMYGFRRGFQVWAMLNVILCLLITVQKFGTAVGGFGWAMDYLIPISCIFQLLSGYSLFRIPVRFHVTGLILVMYYCYTIFNAMIVNRDIGRPVETSLGWQTTHVLCYLAVSLSISQAVYCGEEFRKWLKVAILLFFGFSGMVGFAQLAGIGWVKTMFQTDLVQTIYRPLGTTDYPSQLGFQGFAGMILCGAPIVRRNLKPIEWAGVIFFTLVILCAQYRTMYYAGIVVGLGPIMFFQFRRSVNMGIALSTVVAIGITIPLILFPQKFEYGLRPAANDPALQARQDSWKQLQPILKERPLTGIGADATLMLGTKNIRQDKWSKTVLDNLYVTIYACYGVIGLCFLTAIFVFIGASVLMRMSSTSASVYEWGIVGAISLTSILLVSLTGNSVILATVGYYFAFVLGAGALTWKEEVLNAPVSDLIVAVRKSAQRAFTLFGTNARR
ncbi:MAG TPA: O-antigen ligase family protein [Fimbriimonas sp.]|nr:O-antigen ligase family protein [Fimbriimonas sp.]